MNSEAYYVIVNPNAGGRKGKKIWNGIRRILEKRKIAFHFVLTESRGHAISLTQEAIKQSYRKILVLGGDGTLNEAVNGIFSQDECDPKDVYLGIIPVGTGNDLCRMYGIPKDPYKALHIILKGQVFIQDIGQVRYHYHGEEISRYFANIAGLGYDALVTRKSNWLKDKGYSGIWVYWFNILSALFHHKSIELKISVDEKEVLSTRVYSMSVGNCKYSGGGLPQLPNAISDDGLMDMTIVKRICIWRILGNLHRLFNGSFVNMKEIQTFQGRTFAVQTGNGKEVYLETDGESLGHSPCTFKIIPRSLNIYVA